MIVSLENSTHHFVVQLFGTQLSIINPVRGSVARFWLSRSSHKEITEESAFRLCNEIVIHLNEGEEALATLLSQLINDGTLRDKIKLG